MNDFWKLDNLGIPSDAARQIREQHERELAAARDAMRQQLVHDGRKARVQPHDTSAIARH